MRVERLTRPDGWRTLLVFDSKQTSSTSFPERVATPNRRTVISIRTKTGHQKIFTAQTLTVERLGTCWWKTPACCGRQKVCKIMEKVVLFFEIYHLGILNATPVTVTSTVDTLSQGRKTFTEWSCLTCIKHKTPSRRWTSLNFFLNVKVILFGFIQNKRKIQLWSRTKSFLIKCCGAICYQIIYIIYLGL